jgi:uncharacterized protein (DUF427 family)
MPSKREIERERERWKKLQRLRPAAIERPGPGQESVWDYPRPPRAERVAALVLVEFAGRVVARSRRALRVCETASPPAYYVPPGHVLTELLVPGPRRTLCEWKGVAHYWSLRVGERHAADAAWSYPEPDATYGVLAGHFAFHPGRVDACSVDGVRVRPQPGEYYGGWITPELVGPFKGEPGSEGW